MLETDAMAAFYPDMAGRKARRYGPRVWRRNRLQTASGFTLDAIGLDTAARGVKVEDAPPDFMVIDDIDQTLESERTVRRKIHTLTSAIIPAGSPYVAVLAVQNLIHPHSVFAQLSGLDTPAEFLRDRIVSGPHPEIRNMAVEERDNRFVIVASEPTWKGQDIAVCEGMINDMGLTAY